MLVLVSLVLLVISLVFSALICMPKSVEVLSRRSTKLASSSSLLARPSMSSEKVRNCPATTADCPFMVIQCLSHNYLQEDVEQDGGEHTSLSYSDCGSEPVPYTVINVDCAGGLVIEVLYHSDQIDVDVVLPYSGPQCFMPYPVERLLEVHEDVIEVLLVLEVLLAQYPKFKDLLFCAAPWSEACLFLSDDHFLFRFQSVQQGLQHNVARVSDEADGTIFLA